MTEKSDEKVGHLNTILAQGGNLNNPISNSANAGGGGGVFLKFRFDWPKDCQHTRKLS